MGSRAGTLVDPISGKKFGATVFWSDETGKITGITPMDNPPQGLILPGFVDAHVHIESSMLPPSEFARVAVCHGVLAAVTDPHEIANVMGIEGIDWMLEQMRQTPFVFGTGAPSCVPSTAFECSGAKLDARDTAELLKRPEITHLSEVMDIEAVLNGDPEMMAKIQAAKDAGKPIDGHAPELSGSRLTRYAAAGIWTDHECTSLDDARNKLNAGMTVMIRHGSASRMQESFLQLLDKNAGSCMFCSDDKHPNDLLKHHINFIVAQAYRNGFELKNILQAATVNAVRHYALPLGLLQIGDSADFQIVSDLNTFTPTEVWLRGKCVMLNGESYLPSIPARRINHFEALPITPEDLRIPMPPKRQRIRVIGILDGRLTTRCLYEWPTCSKGEIVQDPARDLLKVVLLNRYDRKAKPVVGFVNGFGLRRGAIASSVSHDSHFVIAVGVTDNALTTAINEVVLRQGALAVADDSRKVIASLPLPVAGLISDLPPPRVAQGYEDCDNLAKLFGSTLAAPFMLLSFLALPVIPELRITEKGIFDCMQAKHLPLILESDA